MTASEAAGKSGLWQGLYAAGNKVNRYPYDAVVSFVLRRFGARQRAGVRVLDYGCGGGNHARFLAAEGFDVHAVDGAPAAVELTRTAVAETGGAADANHICVADFADLPFADRHFDAVIDRQSLGQNAASDLPRMVEEIFRVLKPDGLYFGMNFSDRHPQLRHGRAAGGGDYGDFSQGVFKGLGQKHFFNVAEIQTLFAPFSIESIDALRLESVIGPNQGSEEFIVVARRPG